MSKVLYQYLLCELGTSGKSICPASTMDNKCQQIDTQTLNTATQPLLVTYQDVKTKEIRKLLFKNEPLTEDLLICSLIQITIPVIKQTSKFRNIVIPCYKIHPTFRGSMGQTGKDPNGSHGIPNGSAIEVVIGAKTLREIVRDTTLLQYLIYLPYNQNRTVKQITSDFITSLAFYCVITYIFGIGDRHSENIMITACGKIFHIDYTWILGDDPKFVCPQMRITSEMKSILTGTVYSEFVELCVETYLIVRQLTTLYINSFIAMDIAHNKQRIYHELIQKLIPGQNEFVARQHIINVIQSSISSIHPAVVDTLHSYTNELRKVTSLISGLWSSKT
jgi:hypothetical protein